MEEDRRASSSQRGKTNTMCSHAKLWVLSDFHVLPVRIEEVVDDFLVDLPMA